MRNSIAANGRETTKILIPTKLMTALKSEAAKRGFSVEAVMHDIVMQSVSR